ncbi:type VII secretion integral membrane protein EccD [Actinoplanes siamensis]|uniref:EccD-like transmembrane domain-containing protein n=1 Tax=Actinoplanes siamensis TaxID=1223317 RepID=A0A919TLY5_9ACTN|nr:type VII secretion integral membrane protein EccD [Actinoplanes siamensis]GIF07746.1 hypothetical protein Asi03nite_52840 [Actinoplanes siamensis]
MSTGLARVTISAPQRRVDVALPEHVPLAELLPDVLRHAGEDLADLGERHGGWVLRRSDGVPLEVGRGLHQQGVRDGEVLHLRPAGDDWPELEYDDVVEAVAEGARRRGGVWTPAATRVTALTAAGIVFTLGLFALLTADPRGGGAGWSGLGAAALLTLAATIASRAYGAAATGVFLGTFALLYAFTGAAALTAAAGAGGTRLTGGPELLAGSAAALLTAVLCGAGVAAGTRVFTAGVTAGGLGVLTAPAGLAGGPAAGAATLLAVLACGISVLPVLAIVLGRTPAPPAAPPEPSGAALDAVRRRPDPETVFDAVRRTDELLAGLLLGHAVLMAGASAALAGTRSPAARVLLMAGGLAVLLRSRLFRARRQRLPLLAGGLAAFTALAADLLGTAPAAARPVVTVGCVALGLLVAAAGVAWARRPPPAWPGRPADVLDVVATVSVIPAACWAAGLYAAVGGITL